MIQQTTNIDSNGMRSKYFKLQTYTSGRTFDLSKWKCNQSVYCSIVDSLDLGPTVTRPRSQWWFAWGSLPHPFLQLFSSGVDVKKSTGSFHVYKSRHFQILKRSWIHKNAKSTSVTNYQDRPRPIIAFHPNVNCIICFGTKTRNIQLLLCLW